jgi:hypothetical protein
MNNATFWDVTPCGCCKNLRFGEMHQLHHQGEKNQRPGNASSNYQLKHADYLAIFKFFIEVLGNPEIYYN